MADTMTNTLKTDSLALNKRPILISPFV